MLVDFEACFLRRLHRQQFRRSSTSVDRHQFLLLFNPNERKHIPTQSYCFCFNQLLFSWLLSILMNSFFFSFFSFSFFFCLCCFFSALFFFFARTCGAGLAHCERGCHCHRGVCSVASAVCEHRMAHSGRDPRTRAHRVKTRLQIPLRQHSL